MPPTVTIATTRITTASSVHRHLNYNCIHNTRSIRYVYYVRDTTSGLIDSVYNTYHLIYL